MKLMNGQLWKHMSTTAIGLFVLCHAAMAEIELGGIYECYMLNDDRVICSHPLNEGFEFGSSYMAIPVCGVPSGATITPVVTPGTLSGVTGLKVWTDRQMVDYFLADWNKGNDLDYEWYSWHSGYDGDEVLWYETSRCSYEIESGIWDSDKIDNREVTPRTDRRWILFKGKIPKGEWGGMKTFTVGIKGTGISRKYAAYSTVNGTLGIRPSDFFNRVTVSGYDTKYDFALEPCDAAVSVSREYAGCEIWIDENYSAPLSFHIPEAGTLVLRGADAYLLDYFEVSGGPSLSKTEVYPNNVEESLKKFGGDYWTTETRWKFGGRATLKPEFGFTFFTQLLFFPANAKSVAIVSLQADYDKDHGVSVLRGYVKGSGTFKAGETARLTAVSGGASFKGWEVVYGALPSGVDLTKPTLSFTVPESMCGMADEQKQVTVRAVWDDKLKPSSVGIYGNYNAEMGKVTGTGTFAPGKKTTLKAKANRGFVFAGWYADARFNTPLVGDVDYRTPSIPCVAGAEDVTVYAKFIPISDDAVALDISSVEDEYAPRVAIPPIAVDVSGCVSLPKVTVKGLPPGLKFTAKALDEKAAKFAPAAHYAANTIYGTPTKSGVYETIITVTTAGMKSETLVCPFVVVDRANDERVLRAHAIQARGKVTGAGVYAAGKKIALKAKADKGFVFAGWYADATCETPLVGDGGLDHRTPSLAVVMPNSDVDVYASFVPSDMDASISLYAGGRMLTDMASDTIFNTSGDFTLSLDAKSASLPKIALSGLPSGLKFTAKRIFSRDGSILAEANTVYGKATKPGTYVVTAKLTNTTAGKAIVRRFTVVIDNLTGANDYLRITDATDCEVALKNGLGQAYMVYMGVAEHGLPSISALNTADKVTLSGLPSGLKYDARTGRIAGVAKKVGTYTVAVMVRSGWDTFVSTFTVEVATLPEWAVGTFVGAGACRMSSYESFKDNLNGTVTIAADGKVSGKIRFDTHEDRLLSAMFSSPAITGYDAAGNRYYCDVDLTFYDGRKLVESRNCRLHIEPRSYDGTDAQMIGGISMDEDRFSLSLVQNVWKLKGFAGLPRFAKSKTVVSCEREIHGDPSVSGTSTLKLEIAPDGMVSATVVSAGVEYGEPLFEVNVSKGYLLVSGREHEPDRYMASVALVFGNYGLLTADIEMRISDDGTIMAEGCNITGSSDFADWSY